MGSTAVAWYGTAALVNIAMKDFPKSLADVPLLLPTAQTAVRTRLDQWFEQRGIRPRIVGEIEDSALLKTFGASGMGVFPAADWVHDDLLARYAVQRLGPCEGGTEHFFAVGTEKKVPHHLGSKLVAAGALTIFGMRLGRAQAQQHGQRQDTNDHSKRDEHRYFVDIDQAHLAADEDQNHRQAIVE
jgi:hypothetical protein